MREGPEGRKCMCERLPPGPWPLRIDVLGLLGRESSDSLAARRRGHFRPWPARSQEVFFAHRFDFGGERLGALQRLQK